MWPMLILCFFILKQIFIFLNYFQLFTHDFFTQVELCGVIVINVYHHLSTWSTCTAGKCLQHWFANDYFFLSSFVHITFIQDFNLLSSFLGNSKSLFWKFFLFKFIHFFAVAWICINLNFALSLLLIFVPVFRPEILFLFQKATNRSSTL